jgi:hypothetical protein
MATTMTCRRGGERGVNLVNPATGMCRRCEQLSMVEWEGEATKVAAQRDAALAR